MDLQDVYKYKVFQKSGVYKDSSLLYVEVINVDQVDLLDVNLYKVISRCFINRKQSDICEIFVIYADDTRETIWTYNSLRYDFDHRDFIGKTKIEAVFYCDRKSPKNISLR